MSRVIQSLSQIAILIARGGTSDRVVPPSGFTTRLTVFASGAMAFLAVFALALSVATARLSDRWAEGLARTATIKVSAPEGQVDQQVAAVLEILETTRGVASSRALDEAEERALLAPWFGPDLPVDTLPIPRLIEVVETHDGMDADGLRLRLQAAAPGAVLDDHTRWRAPLVRAANRVNALGLLAVALITAAMAAMVTLAAGAALAANSQVIRVLRLVGAQDNYIAGAFVRRFTWRAFAGAGAGALAGLLAVALLPAAGSGDGFLTGIGFQGASWLLPLAVPIFAALVALVATYAAARRALKELT